jgi:hypothetical protein
LPLPAQTGLDSARKPKLKWLTRVFPGSARVPRASSGGAPELLRTLFLEFPTGKSLWNGVFGATPKTTRETRALPESHSRDPNSSSGFRVQHPPRFTWKSSLTDIF